MQNKMMKKTSNFQQINCTGFLPIHFSIIDKMQNEKGEKRKKAFEIISFSVFSAGRKRGSKRGRDSKILIECAAEGIQNGSRMCDDKMSISKAQCWECEQNGREVVENEK